MNRRKQRSRRKSRARKRPRRHDEHDEKIGRSGTRRGQEPGVRSQEGPRKLWAGARIQLSKPKDALEGRGRTKKLVPQTAPLLLRNTLPRPASAARKDYRSLPPFFAIARRQTLLHSLSLSGRPCFLKPHSLKSHTSCMHAPS